LYRANKRMDFLKGILPLGWVGPLVCLFLSSCSQYSQKSGAIAYHNFSSNYNALFLAKANLDSAEWGIANAYKENPNLLLPILLPIDSVAAQPFKQNLDQAVKNASVIGEKHQNSKWLDNAYTILGKARMYLGQWDDGIEALRYVLAKSTDENDKNEALTFLMRTYIEKKEYTNALSISEYLRQQPLSTGATIDFYLTKAYLHQQTKEYLTAVAILEEALPLVKRSPLKARLHYIAGQLYDLLGKPALANPHYARVPKNKPHYDLSFFAKMNSLQNDLALNAGKGIEEIGFSNMLKDRKNSDLRDKVYLTMGKLAEQKGDYAQALGYYAQSAKAPGANASQIPFTYLEMARIYSDRLMQFEPAKAYFDSAMTLLPPTDPSYQQMVERKKFLDQFVAHVTIIRTEDSLQHLASLNQSQLGDRVDQIITDQQEERKRNFEKQQAAIAAMATADANANNAPTSGPRWLLYDPSQVSLGKSDFARKWGNRKLEDNWRRSNKSGSSSPQDLATSPSMAADSAALTVPQENFQFVPIVKDSEEWLALKESLLRNVPLTDSAMTVSHQRKEQALYHLGKMYWSNLKEPKNAVVTFTRLLNDYPKSDYRQEAYYIIYLALSEDDPAKDTWKNKLTAEFPNSTYVRLLNTATAGSPDSPAEKVYQDIYSLYSSGKSREALAALDDALPLYREHEMIDRFALLRLFIVGRVEGVKAYKEAILDFMRLYPESQYIARTKEMLAVAEQAALLPEN
jgi:tetratricopeptide (TPR) repeat protein